MQVNPFFRQQRYLASAPKFQGYGAMPLDSLYLQPSFRLENREVFRQLKAIGDREGIQVKSQLGEDVYSDPGAMPVVKMSDMLDRTSFQKLIHNAFIQIQPKIQTHCLDYEGVRLWGQDSKLFLKKPDGTWEIAVSDRIRNSKLCEMVDQLAAKLKLPVRELKSKKIEGGDLFIGKRDDGKPYVLVGYHTLAANFPLAEENKNLALEQARQQLADDLHVPESAIVEIPQPAFHLDVMLRPLAGNNILVNDFDLGRQLLQDALAQSENASERKQLQTVLDKLGRFQRHLTYPTSNYAETSHVIEALKKAGFNPVRIPGAFPGLRWDEGQFSRILNYINAIVHQRPDGSLVYITNDTGMPTLNRLFQRKLQQTCPEITAVDFISGGQTAEGHPFMVDCLENSGGIHCMAAEKPV